MTIAGRWALRAVADTREDLDLVDTTEMRGVLRLDPDSASDDGEIDVCLRAGLGLLERRYRLVFGRQAFTFVLDAAPCGPVMRFPIGPLLSVTSFTYYDTDDVAHVLTEGTDFELDTLSLPGRLMLKNGVAWPSSLRDAASIVVQFTAGYAEAEDVPEVVPVALRQVAAFLFEHRGEGSGEFTLPPIVEDLMADLDRPEA